MTTLAALHRNNEIVALLAAGIPVKRILVPILVGVLLVIVLGIVNREIVLPANSELLQRLHEDIDGENLLIPPGQIDKNQVLFRASNARRSDESLENLNLTLPEDIVGQLQEVRCARAYFRRDPETNQPGWLLHEPSPIHIARPSEKLKRLPNGDLFLFSNLTFRDMIRRKNWIDFASTSELLEHLGEDVAKDPQGLRILIHGRLLQPLLDLLLVLIGIPFVLQWERHNIYRSIAVSMVVSALFLVTSSCANYFASFGYLDAVTAAWMPVFLFGPLALSLFHRMGT